MRGAALACALAVLPLCLPADDAKPADPLDLRKTYVKGSAGKLEFHLTVDDTLSRNLPGKNQWAPYRKQQLDWGAKLSWSFKKSSEKTVVLEAVLEDFRGTWADQLITEDKSQRDLCVTFVPLPAGEKPDKDRKPDAWRAALEGFSGTRFEIELGQNGGVSHVSGLGAATAKRFEKLLADKATKALAKELSAWLSDEGWAGILDALFLPSALPKVKRKYALPWTLDLGGMPLPAVSASFRVERKEAEASVEGGFEEGKVDWQKPIPDISPGYHNLGTEQKGVLKAVYGPAGLREASADFTLRDGWDFRGSTATHFDHVAKVSLSAKAP